MNANVKEMLHTSLPEEVGFDPEDWDAFEKLASRALKDMIQYMRTVRERPVWKPIPEQTKAHFQTPVPWQGAGLEAAYSEAMEHVVPYPTGNLHPRFWSWVGGTGTPQAFVADILISGMNACNLGFDEMASTYVEMQLIDWLKGLFEMPASSSGLLVSGGSMANLVGLTVARNVMLGTEVRRRGVHREGQPTIRLYASTETHSSVRKAVEVLGLGNEAMHLIDADDAYRMPAVRLQQAIDADRRDGFKPAIVIANAGTVNTGASDPMVDIAEICAREGLWMHVDGAFGALAKISTLARDQVDGLEHADSLAFDLHKWMYQQYDIGCAIVRHAGPHRRTFNVTPSYLKKLERGIAAGPTNYSSYGIQLSRSAKALRPWLTLKSEGVEKFVTLVDQNIRQARYLTARIDAEPELELCAPTALNIVNFRYVGAGRGPEDLDELNRQILMELHQRGIAGPSSTVLAGRFTIRVAICNHRSRLEDFDALVEGVLKIARER